MTPVESMSWLWLVPVFPLVIVVIVLLRRSMKGSPEKRVHQLRQALGILGVATVFLVLALIF
jgi:cytochrome c-type biogenesis protein CcmH/NrfF